MQNEQKTCQNCKNGFTIEPEDFLFYEKIKVPAPTWCPECRMIRRFLWRNPHNLFRRRDALSGREIFSGFPPHAPVIVYDLEYWNSDAWEPMDYGREYNFSRPFFEQWKELLADVPLPSKSAQRAVHSDYCDHAEDLKNAYLCFEGSNIENSAYIRLSTSIKDSFDIYDSWNDELCYDSLMIDNCNRTFFSMDCDTCTDVWFSKDMTGCNNCFGCVNLRKKSYYIFNTLYSKEEYFAKLKEFNIASAAALAKTKKKAREFWLHFPVKYMHGYKNTDATGEHIQNSKNIRASFDIHGCENIKFSQWLGDNAADSHDYTIWGNNSSLVFECLECGDHISGVKFCWDCWPGSSDVEYSVSCRSSSNLFGCIGLKKKQYCIFNKQYPKDDYLALREKIIRHMNEMPYTGKKGKIYRYGEFFPPEFSPFAYNETLAHDFFPLTKEESADREYAWREPEAKEFRTTINAADLPDSIKDIHDDILRETIQCVSCRKAYRIIPMELDFLRQMGLPMPRICPNCRFLERFKLINPPKFWHGKCQCAGESDDRRIYQNSQSHSHAHGHCPNEFETSYAPDRKEIVYCEHCYNEELVL